jgi:parallel beta-helix repeat protein
MVKRPATLLFLLLLVSLILVAFPQIDMVKAEDVIYIRADGSVDPSTAPIQRIEEVYALVGNIEEFVIVERNNTVFDGSGYTVGGISGPPVVWTEELGWHTNITTGITITNTVINGGGIIFVEASNSIIANNTLSGGRGISWGNGKGNTVYGNRVLKCNYTSVPENPHPYGIGVGGSNNTIIGNYVIGTNGTAISLSTSAYNNTIAGNQIEDNKVGVSTSSIYSQGGTHDNLIYDNNFFNNTENVRHKVVGPADVSVNFWDNGSKGNYWSDYNGTDNDGDGIGDSPHFVYENNQDNYPLMNPVDITTIPEFPSWIVLPFFLAATLSVIIAKKGYSVN